MLYKLNDDNQLFNVVMNQFSIVIIRNISGLDYEVCRGKIKYFSPVYICVNNKMFSRQDVKYYICN